MGKKFRVDDDTIIGIDVSEFDSNKIVFPSIIDGKPINDIDIDNSYLQELCKRFPAADIYIEEGITAVSPTMFNNCLMRSIHLPSTLEYISSECFVNSTLESVTFAENSVCEKIGVGAFEECKNLKSITIPKKVNTIGVSAFKKCISLLSVEFEADSELETISMSAFMDCTALESISIPKSIQSIGAMSFMDSNLKEVIFEENSDLYFVGANTFSRCSKLKSVKFPKPHPEAKANLLFGDAVFKDCENLVSVDFSDTNTNSIPLTMFWGNRRLRTVQLSPSLDSICDSAFEGCESLTDINLQDTRLTTITERSFAMCSWLTIVSFPDTLRFIGKSAFAHCNIATLVLPPNLDSIEDNAFQANPLELGLDIMALENCTEIGDNIFDATQVQTVRIPAFNGEKVSATNLFSNCSALSTVYMYDGARLYAHEFKNCSSLKSIILPSDLKSIPTKAFYHCTSLKDIDIPSSVELIGECAFLGCVLKELWLNSPSLHIYKDAFGSIYFKAGAVHLPMYGITLEKGSFVSSIETQLEKEYPFLSIV